MTRDRRGLLRWYPRGWRDRYQDEMLALLDEQLGEDRAPLRLRLSLYGHGLTERARAVSLFSSVDSREARWRDGSLLVLVAWAAFMVGGAAFAKETEHFDQAVPVGSRLVPDVAFSIVAVGGILGGCLVLAGAALAVPAFVRYLRAGGGDVVRRHIRRAVALTTLTLVFMVPVVVWAHRLNDAQRNGTNTAYGLAFATWAVLGVLSLAGWTAVAAAAGRRVDLRRSAIRAEALLATTLTAVMVSALVAAVTWSAAIATSAPGFLHGAPTETRGSALDVPLAAPLVPALVAMLVATVVGIIGTVHMHNRTRPARDG